MMIKRILSTVLVLVVFSVAALAQSGALKGKIMDKASGAEVPFASVVVELGGSVVGSAQTDFDGLFTIKPLNPGTYTVKATYVGYTGVVISGVIIKSDKTTYQDIKMSSGIDMKVFEKVEYKTPLIDPDAKSGGTVDRAKYQAMASKDISSVASTTAGIAQSDEGKGLSVRGGRDGATDVYIDGERMIGSTGVPQQGVEQITVITGGLPASYGDATAGVINVTTRGASPIYFGGVEAISSQLTDKYGYNFIGYSFGGPLLKTKPDSAGNTRPLIGFSISGEIYTDKDPSPSAIGAWKVNDDTLAWLEKNPVKLAPSKIGVLRNTEFVKTEDLEAIAARQNVRSTRVRFNGKLDIAPTQNLTVTLGGTVDYNNRHDYVYEYALFNPSNNPQSIDNTWRLWGRLTQKFNNTNDVSKEKTSSNITNAYYTLQAGYIKEKNLTQDDTHKKNVFDYGYVGKFETQRTKIYQYDSESQSYQLAGYQDTSVVFTRSDLNEYMANYTSQYYDVFANDKFGHTDNLNNIYANGGLINGYRPGDAYSLWYNTGRQYGGYDVQDNSQFRVFTSFSADLYKKHAIQVGLEYEQSDRRAYNVSAIGLWQLMRQLTNLQIADLDKDHPIYRADLSGSGQGSASYYDFDRKYNADAQTQFDKSLREKLGLAIDDKTFIDIDNYAPSTFDLSMFSADDLLQLGSGAVVGYYGYDKNGNRSKNNPSFDDFFTKKDDNGNFTREIGAFRPIYMAGYIQDKFDFKDLKFNIGLRIDRYDANQKVLKDPYVFYETHTASEIADRPSNIGDDFIVYVSDFNAATPAVVGYRDPNSGYPPKWYDADGTEIQDPKKLAQASTSGFISPWVLDPENAKNPSKDLSSKAFKDYVPQINVMPRISFSFPISDVASFFAHYDVLTERPTVGYNRLDPTDYFNIQSSSVGTITNPNLRAQKTTDYELGFSQILNESKSSALTLTSYYRELKDYINIIQRYQAYPKTYNTYENIDFGTVKGFSATYDLRNIGNVSVNASYTLQFANGTGSGPGSNARLVANSNLISSGQPSLRTLIPLDFDQRHNIVSNIDYRYADGTDYNGPILFGKQIFANAGANLTARASSGTPYSRQTNVTQDAASGINDRSNLAGTINGERNPWNLRFDLRIDKNMPLKIGKKGEDGVRKNINMNIYLQILNLLNTKNVLAVYSYTGSPSDDGYLSASLSQNDISKQINEQSFRDLYSIKVNNPANYSIPRRTRIGVTFDF